MVKFIVALWSNKLFLFTDRSSPKPTTNKEPYLVSNLRTLPSNAITNAVECTHIKCSTRSWRYAHSFFFLPPFTVFLAFNINESEWENGQVRNTIAGQSPLSAVGCACDQRGIADTSKPPSRGGHFLFELLRLAMHPSWRFATNGENLCTLQPIVDEPLPTADTLAPLL